MFSVLVESVVVIPQGCKLSEINKDVQRMEKTCSATAEKGLRNHSPDDLLTLSLSRKLSQYFNFFSFWKYKHKPSCFNQVMKIYLITTFLNSYLYPCCIRKKTREKSAIEFLYN